MAREQMEHISSRKQYTVVNDTKIWWRQRSW